MSLGARSVEVEGPVRAQALAGGLELRREVWAEGQRGGDGPGEKRGRGRALGVRPEHSLKRREEEEVLQAQNATELRNAFL